jgi:hypothetical protein
VTVFLLVVLHSKSSPIFSSPGISGIYRMKYMDYFTTKMLYYYVRPRSDKLKEKNLINWDRFQFVIIDFSLGCYQRRFGWWQHKDTRMCEYSYDSWTNTQSHQKITSSGKKKTVHRKNVCCTLGNNCSGS